MAIKALLSGEPLYLMDGSAFIYRGFYAAQNLSRSDGFPTGAIFNVTRILLKVLREERPKRFVMVLDGKGTTFRHTLYPDYKAQRKATPEGLIVQLEPIRRMTAALGLPLIISDGCEADDCIASLAKRFASEGVVMIGTDKDLKQCLSDKVIMWDPAGKDGKITTAENFTAETGLLPSQWPDVQAIIGDSSDNIPGVPGLGIKTAQKLFTTFSSLEDIQARFEELPSAIHKKMTGHEEAVFLYRELTRLKTDCCTEVNKEDLYVGNVQRQEAAALLREFELNSLEREFVRAIGEGSLQSQDQETVSQQGSLLEPTTRQEQAIYTIPTMFPVIYDQWVAILPTENAILMACSGMEWLYSGSIEELVDYLARVVASTAETRLVTPDLKHLFHLDPRWKRIPNARWFDLKLAAYLLNPEQQDYGWPRLVGEWSAALGRSQGNPALLALAIQEALAPRLNVAGLQRLSHNLELPLVSVLADMEERGVQLDLEQLRIFLDEVKSELETLTEQIYTAAGGSFNIRSAQQLGEVLFKRLQLPALRKTSGGQASTSKDVLESLSGKHPVVDALREYRILEKLRSTYLEPLPKLVNKDGRIRTTFNQTGTATGRLSSSNPNLQNIPVRGIQGQRMRACFTASEGHLLVSADYSQIELRVLACISTEPTLIQAFREDADIHARTASLLFDIEPSSVSSDQRRMAKTINFGLIYGMGAQKLGHDLGLSLAEARNFITNYFKHLSRLREFYSQVKAEASAQGFVTTLSGRRRLLPGIHSSSAQLRALAERQAVNSVIQGSAADIIKLAMLAVQRDGILQELNAHLVLQIHDELLIEVPSEHAQTAGQRLANLMENISPTETPLAIPLRVDWGVGSNWHLAH